MKEHSPHDKVKKDAVGANYLKMKQSECFDWLSIFIVELSVSEHSCPELIEG